MEGINLDNQFSSSNNGQLTMHSGNDEYQLNTNDLDSKAGNSKVVVISPTSWVCPNCGPFKSGLTKKGISFKEVSSESIGYQGAVPALLVKDSSGTWRGAIAPTISKAQTTQQTTQTTPPIRTNGGCRGGRCG